MRSLTHLESCCMVRHGSAYPLITAVLLDVGNPLLTLGHDLNSFQVKMFVYNLKNKTIKETKMCLGQKLKDKVRGIKKK